MALIDYAYHNLLRTVLDDGFYYEDPRRKGIKRLQIPQYYIHHDLTKSFPAITTKKLYWKGIVGELIWFLRGDTSIEYLKDNNIKIWHKDGYRYYLDYTGYNDSEETYEGFVKGIDEKNNIAGELGPIYGHQWRNFEGVDQINDLIHNMKTNPMSTELIVNSWNPKDIPDMALPPCHFMFQILPEPLPEGGYGFTLMWSQRSVDTFLGLPFNIASYALLAHILGKITGMVPLKITGDLRNVHLYENSIDAAKQQYFRSITDHSDCQLQIMSHLPGIISNYNKGNKPAISSYDNSLDSLFETFRIKDFGLDDYTSYDAITVPMLSRTN